MAREEKKQVSLIRMMGTDIKADSTLLYGLAQIKGVSIMFSNAVCNILKFDKNKKLSDLSDEETEKIEEFLSNPVKKGIPNWLLNHRKDYVTGEDLHITSKDIDFDLLQLRRRVSKLKTYKSLRYRANLPVRGQRTKSNFRRNKTIAAMKSKRGGN